MNYNQVKSIARQDSKNNKRSNPARLIKSSRQPNGDMSDSNLKLKSTNQTVNREETAETVNKTGRSEK